MMNTASAATPRTPATPALTVPAMDGLVCAGLPLPPEVLLPPLLLPPPPYELPPVLEDDGDDAVLVPEPLPLLDPLPLPTVPPKAEGGEPALVAALASVP